MTYICGSSVLVPVQLFWTAIEIRANTILCTTHGALVVKLTTQAKITDLCYGLVMLVRIQEDISGLQVPMENVTFVQKFKTENNIQKYAQHTLHSLFATFFSFLANIFLSRLPPLHSSMAIMTFPSHRASSRIATDCGEDLKGETDGKPAFLVYSFPSSSSNWSSSFDLLSSLPDSDSSDSDSLHCADFNGVS